MYCKAQHGSWHRLNTQQTDSLSLLSISSLLLSSFKCSPPDLNEVFISTVQGFQPLSIKKIGIYLHGIYTNRQAILMTYVIEVFF